jgi:hypothetical protein
VTPQSHEPAERRADFDAVAEARYARIAATGETIPWQEMLVRGQVKSWLPLKSWRRTR